MKPRTQLKVRLDDELEAVVRRYCAAHNVTQTALVQAALKEYIAGTSPHVVLQKRLDRMSRQLDGQRRMLHLLAEAFGSYVQLWLGHTPEVHADNIESARRDALARYRRWAEHVAKRLTGGDTFFLQFAAAPPAADAAKECEAAHED
jgi:hypothetical protein